MIPLKPMRIGNEDCYLMLVSQQFADWLLPRTMREWWYDKCHSERLAKRIQEAL